MAEGEHTRQALRHNRTAEQEADRALPILWHIGQLRGAKEVLQLRRGGTLQDADKAQPTSLPDVGEVLEFAEETPDCDTEDIREHLASCVRTV